MRLWCSSNINLILSYCFLLIVL